jgi:hypothetical protein
MALDPVKIEDRLDKAVAGATAISTTLGGVQFESMLQIMEASKLLSLSGPAIPRWLQNNPGGCWAIMIQAIEWGVSPIGVARMSFEVNGQVGYMSQLLHAIVEKRAPLKQRLRCSYEGEGDERVCIITGHFKGEMEPVIYRSPPLGKITPKNSPLWRSDVDQQLFHFSVRAWSRRYAPDCLLGIYSKDELEDGQIGPENAQNITPKPDIASRLKGPTGRGFSPEHVEAQTAPAVEHKPAETIPEPSPKEVVAALEPLPNEVQAAQGVIDVPKKKHTKKSPEPPLDRARRLMLMCRSREDVENLVHSIREELSDAAEIAALNELGAARAKEL